MMADLLDANGAWVRTVPVHEVRCWLQTHPSWTARQIAEPVMTTDSERAASVTDALVIADELTRLMTVERRWRKSTLRPLVDAYVKARQSS